MAFWRGDINPQKPFFDKGDGAPDFVGRHVERIAGALMERAFALERITAEDDGGALILLSAEEEKGAIAGQLEMLNVKRHHRSSAVCTLMALARKF